MKATHTGSSVVAPSPVTNLAVYGSLTLVIALSAGCSRKTPNVSTEDAKQAGIQFTRLLCARDYAAAAAMTAPFSAAQLGSDQLKMSFERMIPLDWKSCEPLEVMQTMSSWPDKKDGDVAWLYISIPGDLYSEAVTVVVADQNGRPKIRSVEWGRP